MSEFTFKLYPGYTFQDSEYDQTICGDKTIKLKANSNTFVTLSYTNTDKWIKVAPTLNSHKGSYTNMKIILSFDEYPLIQ